MALVEMEQGRLGKAFGWAPIMVEDYIANNQNPLTSVHTDELQRERARQEGVDPYSFPKYEEKPSAPQPTPEQEYIPEEPPEEIGVLMPDPQQDPAGAIKSLSVNRAAGMGNSVGLQKPPKAPTMKQFESKIVEQEGKQVLFDQNKIPKWNESEAFAQGLMSFGLNLLSGNDLITSFNQAGGHFEKTFAKEKRQNWANDLIQQGYDAHDVQAWIETGDQKALKDPMEKKRAQQQYQLGQMQLQKAEYETSPEYQQYQRDVEDYRNQLEQAKFVREGEFQNATLALRQKEMDMNAEMHQQKLEALQQKLQNGDDLTSRDYSQLYQTTKEATKNAQQKLTSSNLAQKDLDDLEAAIKRGDKAAAAAAYTSFSEHQARAMVGGGATLSHYAIEGATDLPDAPSRWANKVSLQATGVPTEHWLKAQRSNVTNNINNEHSYIREQAESTFAGLAPSLGERRARQVVHRLYSGMNLGDITVDGAGRIGTHKEYAGPDNVKINR